MIAALLVLAGAVAVLAVVVGVLVRTHQGERSEWAAERRALVDRAIARHGGEIIALDRAQNAKPKQQEDRPPALIEGLT